MVQDDKGIYQFSSFLQFKDVVHGFSTRQFGSMEKEKFADSLLKFAGALDISGKNVISMDQVHDTTVKTTGRNDSQAFCAQTDGLVTKENDCYLCVRTADCVPIMAFDPKRNIFGVAHSGWKGSLGNIAKKLVEEMGMGDIFVGIGPSIRVCCYSIDKDRAKLFLDAFPKIADTILEERKGIVYLNLQKLVVSQLVAAGVNEKNIEDSGICTYDNKDFFCYRDKNIRPGLFAGIIGGR